MCPALQFASRVIDTQNSNTVSILPSFVMLKLDNIIGRFHDCYVTITVHILPAVLLFPAAVDFACVPLKQFLLNFPLKRSSSCVLLLCPELFATQLLGHAPVVSGGTVPTRSVRCKLPWQLQNCTENGFYNNTRLQAGIASASFICCSMRRPAKTVAIRYIPHPFLF